MVLHGRGNNHASAFDRNYLGLDRFLAASVRAGGTPFALASVDGGETYWHERDGGEDAGAMVVDEFIPMLAEHGLDTRRVGFLGWSMGGYGALALAGRLGPARTVAVAAESPALWHDFADSAPGAFDSPSDFIDATVFGRQNALDGIKVRIDCGEGDPFYAATRDYVEGFTLPPAGGFQPEGTMSATGGEWLPTSCTSSDVDSPRESGTPLRALMRAREGCSQTLVWLTPDFHPGPLAVAVGFEPTVGLTPHIISSDAPSAARTRHRAEHYRRGSASRKSTSWARAVVSEGVRR